MSEPNDKKTNDNYDALLEKFSFSGSKSNNHPSEDDVKNSGEIYFSANTNVGAGKEENKPISKPSVPAAPAASSPVRSQPVRQHILIPEEKTVSQPVGNANRTARPTANKPASAKTASGRTAAGKATSKKSSASSGSAKKTNASKINRLLGANGGKSTMILIVGVVAMVIAVSLLIRIPLIGCMNDILAIDRGTDQIRVVIEKGMSTKNIIDLLGDKDLIYSSGFCKLVSGFLGYDNDIEYPAGTYNLSPDMGVEGMLNEIIAAGSKEATVSITFPEGYTVNQIADRLSSNGVCSTTDFYAALKNESFYTDYDFLANLANKNSRYRALEGYLYPDTYEFYIGENANSVVKRFLDNFASKWNDLYAERLERTDWTVDEILTVASILEKEAFDSEQMPLIASVIYNRLSSSSFPFINCDSTAKYIEAYKEDMQAEGSYDALIKVYDTYQKTGLPIGPICNPGADAIDAALSPDSTDYYYFLHDKAGKLYTARTQAEHEANQVHMNDE